MRRSSRPETVGLEGWSPSTESGLQACYPEPRQRGFSFTCFAPFYRPCRSGPSRRPVQPASTRLGASRSCRSLSPNRRRPVPSTTGKTIRCSSSTRSCSSSSWTSRRLPGTWMIPSISSLSFDASSAALPLRTVVLFHSGPRGSRTRRTWAFVLNLSANSPLAIGPGAGEALVGDAPDQEHVALHRLVELELVAVVSAIELEAPTGVLELFAARRLHHAVERHELGHHQLAHLALPPVAVAECDRPCDRELIVGAGDLSWACQRRPYVRARPR